MPWYSQVGAEQPFLLRQRQPLCTDLGGCRGGSAVPSMPCIRPRGRGSDFPRQLPLQGWARSPAAAAGSS